MFCTENILSGAVFQGRHMKLVFLCLELPLNCTKSTEFLAVIMEQIILAESSKKKDPRICISLKHGCGWTPKNLQTSPLPRAGQTRELSLSAYSYTPRGIMKPLLFGEANEELELISRETCSGLALTLLAIGPTPLPCKLELRESVFVYNSQRVLSQLGYYQRTVKLAVVFLTPMH